MILDILHRLFKKKLRMNCAPEIRNGCDFWEQAFRRYCVTLSSVQMLTDGAILRLPACFL